MSLVFYHMVAKPGEPILPEWGLESLGLLVGFIISQGTDEKNGSAACGRFVDVEEGVGSGWDSRN